MFIQAPVPATEFTSIDDTIVDIQQTISSLSASMWDVFTYPDDRRGGNGAYRYNERMPLVITKLHEAVMWLGYIKQVNGDIREPFQHDDDGV